MNFLLSQIRIFFTNRFGLLLVFANLVLAVWGLAEKDWNYSGFHFTYEPTAVQILTIINLFPIFFSGEIYSAFYSPTEMASSLIEIKDLEMFLIVMFSIFQWLLIGYGINFLVSKSESKIK